MSLPEGYAITQRRRLLYLYREGQGVYACPNKGSAEEALKEVAEWHARERAALIATWRSPHGSEEQEAWEGLRKEAEGKLIEAQKRASGAK